MNDKQEPNETPEEPPREEREANEVAQCAESVREMERQVRNMRLAIIVIVAFFIYDTLAPDGFRDRTHTLTRIETQELRVVDERGRALMHFSAGDTGAMIRLDDPEGARLTIEPKALIMRPLAGQAVPRMELSPTGARAYHE